MNKFWNLYKFYFKNGWKNPLYIAMILALVYGEIEDSMWVKAIVYSVFFIAIWPLLASLQRLKMDYENEDVLQNR